MSIKTKIFAFLAFCFVSAIIFACSEDFITSTSAKESVKVNKDLKGVSAVTIRTGLRDSLFTSRIGVISHGNVGVADDQKILPHLFYKPGVHQDTTIYPNYLDTTAAYLREFKLSWEEVEGVAGYEVRVYQEKITEENWHFAEKVMLISEKKDNGTITAWARMTPTPKVYMANCVNCGECKKACPTEAISYINSKAVIDYDKCIDCGECFRACDYNAIGGVFSGTDYYFAIRTFDSDTAYSEKITNSDGRYRMQYTTLATLPDSLIDDDPSDDNNVVKLDFGCGGNCTDGSSGNSRGDCDTCHILRMNTCPVDAVYEIDTLSVNPEVTDTGAMFIDAKKCINCGKCAITCYREGGWGAVVTEIVKVD